MSLTDDQKKKLDDALGWIPGDVAGGLTTEKRVKDTPSIGTLSAIKLTIQNDWVTSEVIRSGRDALTGAYTIDEDYIPTGEELKFVADEYNIPDEFRVDLARSLSPDHMVYVAKNLQTRLEAYREIDKALPGALNPIRLGTNIGDPLPLLIGGGVSKVGGIGRSVYLSQRVVRGAAANVAIDLPLEAARVSLNPVEGTDAVFYSVAGSAVFGGFFNSFGKKMSRSERQSMATSETKGASSPAKSLSPKSIEATEGGVLPVTKGEVTPVIPVGKSSVGAAQAEPSVLIDPINEAAQSRLDAIEETFDPGRAFAPGVRFDLESSLNSAPDAATRELTQQLIPSQAGLADAAINRASAADFSRRINDGHGRFHRRAGIALANYWKKRDVKLVGLERETTFFREVGMVLDGARKTDDPDVLKAVQAYRELYEDALMHTKDSKFEFGGGGVSNKDFENVEPNANYQSRFVNSQEYGELRTKLGGDEGVARKLVAPILRGNIERLRKSAAKTGRTVAQEGMIIARAYLHTIRIMRSNLGNRNLDERSMTAASRKKLREEALTAARKSADDGIRELDEGAVNAAIDMILPNLDKAESPRAKSRLKLILDADLDADIMRLWEWDARRIANAYSRHMSGLAGLLRAGFRSEAEVDTRISDIKSAGEQGDNIQLKRAERNADNLTFVKNSIMGRRTRPLNDFDRKWEMGANWLKRWAFTRYLNNVGFSMFTEIGGVISQLGFTRSIRQVPAVWKMYNQLRRGEEPEGLVAFADSMFGSGSQQVRARLAFKEGTVESANIDDVSRGTNTVERIDDVTNRVSNLSAKLSGLAPLNELMRLTLISGEIEAWAKRARTGKKFSKRRLAWLGLDDKTVEAINRNLLNTSEIETSNGGKVSDVKIDQWDDQEAAQAFITALDRNSRRVILQGDIGGRARWMEERPSAGIALQFMNFAINAHTKHLLFGMNVRDMEAVNELIMFSIFGGIGYMARIHAVSISMSENDRRDYLKKKLAPAELGKAIFYYSAHASFIPQAHDTVAQFVPGYEPRLASVRSSSMSGQFFDPVNSSPVFSGLNDVMRGIKGITRDGEIEREDVKAIVRGALPFQNAWYLGWLLNPLINSFPEDDDVWDLDE